MAQAEDILAGLIPEAEMAKALGVTVRTMRKRRKLKQTSPWCRIGRDVYYYEQGVPGWLKKLKHGH